MKKFYLLFIVILGFSACETSPKQFNDTVMQNIQYSEKLVLTYDSIVDKALLTGNTEKIRIMSEDVSGEILMRIDEVKKLKPTVEGTNLKVAAISYLESMMEFVIAQKIYTNLTDSLTQDQAAIFDNKNANIVRNLKASSQIYHEYQSAYSKIKKLN
ncbi:hypothetical protein D0T53_02810 [Dysgonomonas sp. 216]|uniref:hypothetical protein n=1 Tax=Dysgonomonas sp. 216 TaxID=2302934 RepID=UPI0013D2060F|nr:hypothetical protein [Dysgonomonas sp. 216]NDW17847.1 hypothetical protein [Dysgonomonas sp. 216]